MFWIAECEKNKSPNFYIRFSLCSQEHKRICISYFVYNKIIPKDDHHFGFKKIPLEKHW
jgi:hypothetical protein